MLLKNNVREAGHVQLFLTVTPIVQLCVCAHPYCHKYTHQTLIYGDDVHLPTTSYVITLLEGGVSVKRLEVFRGGHLNPVCPFYDL